MLANTSAQSGEENIHTSIAPIIDTVLNKDVFVCVHVCVCVCVLACVYVCVSCVCAYVWAHVCACVCMYLANGMTKPGFELPFSTVYAILWRQDTQFYHTIKVGEFVFQNNTDWQNNLQTGKIHSSA